jgi:hypothetical protein
MDDCESRAPMMNALTRARPTTVPPTTPFQRDEADSSPGAPRTVESGVMTVALTGGRDP